MREVLRAQAYCAAIACAVALAVAGCVSGGGTPPPQLVQPALRGKTYEAIAATYRVGTGAIADYSRIREASPNTTVIVSSDGSALQFAVNETTDAGSAVSFNQTLTLPPEGSESSSGLYYPAANRSLSHMAFGEWAQITTSLAIGGFFAFGNATPGPAIPTTGSAIYAGNFVGMIWGFLGDIGVSGTLNATADFDNRRVGIQGNTGVPNSSFSGTLGYDPGTNAISGMLVTGGSLPYQGTARAQFFGPGAEELGGAFRMTRVECFISACMQGGYMGSFGAKRQ